MVYKRDKQTSRREQMITFMSFTDLLSMGGHGGYVWSAYGLSIFLMLLNVVLIFISRRRYLDQLSRCKKRDT